MLDARTRLVVPGGTLAASVFASAARSQQQPYRAALFTYAEQRMSRTSWSRHLEADTVAVCSSTECLP